MGEARHFKFDRQVNIAEYQCMYDRYPKWGVFRSCDVFKFWEITDNI